MNDDIDALYLAAACINDCIADDAGPHWSILAWLLQAIAADEDPAYVRDLAVTLARALFAEETA